MAILTEAFRGFFFQSRHDRFFPNPFQFIIHQSYYLTLCILDTENVMEFTKIKK
jgi:hypothetical protein